MRLSCPSSFSHHESLKSNIPTFPNVLYPNISVLMNLLEQMNTQNPGEDPAVWIFTLIFKTNTNRTRWRIPGWGATAEAKWQVNFSSSHLILCYCCIPIFKKNQLKAWEMAPRTTVCSDATGTRLAHAPVGGHCLWMSSQHPVVSWFKKIIIKINRICLQI